MKVSPSKNKFGALNMMIITKVCVMEIFLPTHFYFQMPVSTSQDIINKIHFVNKYILV